MDDEEAIGMNELDKQLRALKSLQKRIKISMAMTPAYRNVGYLKEFFGQRGLDKSEYAKPIENIGQAVDNYVTMLEKGLRDEYDKRRESQTISQAGLLHSEIQPAHRQDQSGYTDTSKETGVVYGNNNRLTPDSIFNPKLPGQKATLATYEEFGCDQVTTAQQLFDNIHYKKIRGQQLIAPPGSGKTYILGSLIKNLDAIGFFAECLSPWACLYITRASVVPQSQEDLRYEFGLDIHGLVQVINVEMLRAQLVGTLIEESTEVINGEPQIIFNWRRGYQPRLIISDESHYYARPDSLQSRVANSIFDDLHLCPWEVFFVDSSATPWSRISEAKHFALASGAKLNGQNITPATWPTLSSDFARDFYLLDGSQANPEAYCPEAVRAFANAMEENIVWIRDFKPKHKAILKLEGTRLTDPALLEEYHNAELEHHKRKAQIEGNESLSAQQAAFATLASYTIFSKAAENCHRYDCAKEINDAWNAGYAPTLCFGFKQTAVSIIRILIEDYNWKREDISIIWGGSTEALTAKKKLAARLKNAKAQALLEELEIDVEADLGLFASDFKEKTEEQYKWEKDNDLLSQKPESREKEKLRFNRQDSRCCLYSYKSGGVGLSLHHQIKYPNARPRRSDFIPDYSEKLGIQALYRTARLTSASDTVMTYRFYTNTIEAEKMDKFRMKCESLKQVTQGNEVWAEIDEEERSIISNIDLEF